MSKKKRIQILTDIAMTLLLLLLMSYQIIDGKTHEMLGIGMGLLFILHHILNRKWFSALFKGTYSAYRWILLILNLTLLLDVILIIISGISMSGHILRDVGNVMRPSLARRVHLAGSYWGLVLMSCHIGFHWNMVTKQLKKHLPLPAGRGLILAGLILAMAGGWEFLHSRIASYMILSTEFAAYDYSRSNTVVLFFNFAMISCWVCCSYYLCKIMLNRKRAARKF